MLSQPPLAMKLSANKGKLSHIEVPLSLRRYRYDLQIEVFIVLSNPGDFAKLSGASRRKMNIKSSIGRPPDQQCQIVDNIPLTAKGYNDWENFFSDPYC